MSSVNSKNERPDTTGVCCVLWAQAGTALPSALLKVLEQRRLSVVSVRHRFAALSEVVRAHTSMARANAAAAGGVAARVPILVFVEPEELDGAAEVFRALELSAPGALCWRYRQHSVPKLGMFLADEVEKGQRVDPVAGSAVGSASAFSTPGLQGGNLPEIVINPAISVVMREPSAERKGDQRLSIRPVKSAEDGGENRSAGRAGSENGPGVPGRAPELRLAGGGAEWIQASPETPDIRDGMGPGAGGAGANRSAPIRPREREDFSRIITEEELTMLLADRDTKS